MNIVRMIMLGWMMVLAGCTGGASTAEVSGEVKKASGEAMDNTTVVFYPTGGASVVTKTDATGAFKAIVPVGTAKIAVMDASEASSEDSSPAAAAAKPKVQRIKAKYATPELSGLTVNVGEQKDKLVLTVD